MEPGLRSEIRSNILAGAEPFSDAAGRQVTIIREAAAIDLAGRYHLHLREVYAEVLSLGIWPYRYIRNKDSFTLEDQLKLIQSRVAVIGAGGLGGYIILLLARMGIGFLVIADPEKFDETNLNRQALATLKTINLSKVAAAENAIASVNPAVEIIPYAEKLTPLNAEKILSRADVVADALDNIPDRLLLQEAAQKLNIPLVHAALAGFEGQVMSVFPDDKSLNIIYGDKHDQNPGMKSPESILGIPAITPAVIGALQVMEILKILLHKGKIFQRRMMYAQLETGQFDELALLESGK